MRNDMFLEAKAQTGRIGSLRSGRVIFRGSGIQAVDILIGPAAFDYRLIRARPSIAKLVELNGCRKLHRGVCSELRFGDRHPDPVNAGTGTLTPLMNSVLYDLVKNPASPAPITFPGLLPWGVMV